MPKCLTQLPAEILNAIFTACEFDKNERLNLRLVCKEFDQSQMITSLAFKTVRLQDFTREAFDNVFKLSQSRLAPYVTHFEYKVIEFQRPRTIHEVDRLIGLEPSGPFDGPGHIEEWASRLLQEHSKWLLQQDIIGTFYDAISLSKALPSFQSLRSVIISRFDPYAPEYPPMELEPSMTQAFWAVIKALNLCSIPIESFKMEVLFPYTLALPDVYHDSCHDQVRIALSGLKSLELPRLAYFRPDRGFAALQDVLQHIFLTECILLESLILGQHDYDNHGIYGVTVNFMELVLPRLQVFELRMDHYEQIMKEDLVRFIRYHRKLRRLVLSGIVMIGPVGWNQTEHVPVSSWEEAFSRVRGVGIAEVELDDLSWTMGSDVYNNVMPQDLRKFEGWLKEQSVNLDMS